MSVALLCLLAACGPRDSDNGVAGVSPSGATDTGGSGGSGGTPDVLPDSGPDSGGSNTTPSPSPSGSPDSSGSGATPSTSPSGGSDPENNGASPSASPSVSPDSGGNNATPDSSPSVSPDNSGSDGGGGTGLAGTPEEILVSLLESLADSGIETPMSMPPIPVTAEQSQNTIGLSEADFERYVASAAQSMAAIGTFAHQVIIIQGVDDNAAGQIKALVSGKDGYDSQKWICVFPEKTVAIDSGPYVLLVAAKRAVADAAVEFFKAAGGSVGEAVTFWEFME